MGRRSFLRRGLGLAVEKARDAFGLAAASRERVETAGNLLPQAALPAALVTVAPAIDVAACTGCDACARLCPGQAIQFEAREDALAYRISPQDCTGCGICVDVCADRAVRLASWVIATPSSLPLDQATCARCGVRFHRPVIDRAGGKPRCPICERKGEVGKLFRVQE
jgi:Pyruvate/2-oxoacid:ferredoxin oxidoreductase delta subunit